MLFEMILFKFNSKDIIQANSILGPLCFSLFITFVGFIFMNMYLSIINESFQHARQNQTNYQHIFSFMFNKFLRWARLKKLNHLEIAEERDIRMRTKYLNAIDAFPQKIDQLFDALNRVCFIDFTFLFIVFSSSFKVNQQNKTLMTFYDICFYLLRK